MGNSRSYSRKKLENRPKIACIGSSISCVFVMLLKVVSHYDSCVCLDGVVGGVSSIQFYVLFLTLQSPLDLSTRLQ